MALDNLLERTPLGSRIIFGLCIVIYALYSLDHHAFVALDLTCRPVDVIYGLQLQRLLFASFAHTTLPGLCLALALSWRRFAWLEHEFGTLGFLLWFMWCSVLLHAVYSIVFVLLSPIFGGGSMGSEVHGLFPLLTASLVSSMHASDASEVWLWPFPVHVSVRVLPLIIIVLAWLLHWEAHYDVAVAYVLGRAAPWLLMPEVVQIAERMEQTPAGRWVLGMLQASDAYVCRPPFLSSEAPCAVPGKAGPKPAYHDLPDAEHGLAQAKPWTVAGDAVAKGMDEPRAGSSHPEPLPAGYVDEAML